MQFFPKCFEHWSDERHQSRLLCVQQDANRAHDNQIEFLRLHATGFFVHEDNTR